MQLSPRPQGPKARRKGARAWRYSSRGRLLGFIGPKIGSRKLRITMPKLVAVAVLCFAATGYAQTCQECANECACDCGDQHGQQCAAGSITCPTDCPCTFCKKGPSCQQCGDECACDCGEQHGNQCAAGSITCSAGCPCTFCKKGEKPNPITTCAEDFIEKCLTTTDSGSCITCVKGFNHGDCDEAEQLIADGVCQEAPFNSPLQNW